MSENETKKRTFPQTTEVIDETETRPPTALEGPLRDDQRHLR